MGKTFSFVSGALFGAAAGAIIGALIHKALLGDDD